MHANGTGGDEREKTGFANDRMERMVGNRVGGDASHDASNAMDHLCGATLTERVVGFLERYNQSVFEFGRQGMSPHTDHLRCRRVTVKPDRGFRPVTGTRYVAAEQYLKELPPSGVNLGACPVASEERGLEFFAFDASYLEKLRSGDAQTEEHFVRYFSELIRLKLRSRLNSREAIEDVRQETFVRVLSLLRAKKGLRQADRLGAFVNSVCNNVLLEHYRSKSKSDTNLEDAPDVVLVNRGPDALSLLETKDTERIVRQILNELTERDRSLLRSVLLEERDKDEVCAELGITREYLRVLIHRAKQSFRDFYMNRLGEKRPGSL